MSRHLTPSRQLTRRFVAEPYSVRAARRACLDIGERLDPGLCDRLALLVSELVSDSVRHLRGRSDALIRVEVASSDDALSVEVTDPDDRFQGAADAQGLLRTAGWGLIVLDALADDWGFGEGPGARVWFEIERGTRLGQTWPRHAPRS